MQLEGNDSTANPSRMAADPFTAAPPQARADRDRQGLARVIALVWTPTVDAAVPASLVNDSTESVESTNPQLAPQLDPDAVHRVIAARAGSFVPSTPDPVDHALAVAHVEALGAHQLDDAPPVGDADDDGVPSLTSTRAESGGAVSLDALDARDHGAPEMTPTNDDRATVARTSTLAPPGIVELTDGDAVADARAAHREALREGAPDPLDGLAERIAPAEGRPLARPELAFDPLVIAAALDLRNDDGPAFVVLRNGLKRAGVNITPWSAALDAEARARKAAAKQAERDALRRAGELRAEAAEAERVALAAKLAAEREARPDLAAHFNQRQSNGATFVMEPGRTVMRVPGKPDVVLAQASAVFVADVAVRSAPDAKPTREHLVSVMYAGDETPRLIEVTGDKVDLRGSWLQLLGSRACIAAGKGHADALRHAVDLLSKATPQERCNFIGWVKRDGRWIYLHAGGAIGEAGAVEGMTATPAAPVDRFALPVPPVGEELARAVRALDALLSMEPAHVMVPMVALAFHAPLGGSRLAVHVYGPPDTGKSVRASLVQRLFGAAMHAKAPPVSWADGSTSVGIADVLSRAGDALVMVDDLRVTGGHRDDADAVKVDRVFRAHFNGAAPLKGRREGGARTDPASRCDLLSTGEVLPRGSTASTLNRVVTIELEAPLPANINELVTLAADGTLAAGMAAYLRWLAPQVEDLRPRARAEEREAATRWGFTAGTRAEELLGGLCLGMEHLLTFLGAHGMTAADVERHQARARAALHHGARVHRARVVEEGLAPRFGELLMQALRSGAGYALRVKRADPPGKGIVVGTPADAHLWGHQRRGDDLVPASGARLIAYQHHLHPDALCVVPAEALAVVQRVAKDSGRTLGADVHAMGKALHAAGYLARTDLDTKRPRPTVRARVASGNETVDLWIVKRSALGLDDAPGDDDPAPVDPDDGTGPGPDPWPGDVDPLTDH